MHRISLRAQRDCVIGGGLLARANLPVAQRMSTSLRTRRYAGSTPAGKTILSGCRGVCPSPPALEAGDRWLESTRPDQQRLGPAERTPGSEPGDSGSIPGGAAKRRAVAKQERSGPQNRDEPGQHRPARPYSGESIRRVSGAGCYPVGGFGHVRRDHGSPPISAGVAYRCACLASTQEVRVRSSPPAPFLRSSTG